jgi:hypothetical protein
MFELEAVLRGTVRQGGHPRQLDVIRGDDKLAHGIVADLVGIAEFFRRALTRTAELRLERTGGVVDAGVDDTRVVPGLRGGDVVGLVQDDDFRARTLLQQRPGGPQADDARPHDDVVLHDLPFVRRIRGDRDRDRGRRWRRSGATGARA